MPANAKRIAFRHSAGFGKRIEFWIISRMLKEGLDVYVPLVDDSGIDAVVRRPGGSFAEVQIKARSKDVKSATAAQFSVISHREPRKDYYFVFYSEALDKTWVMTSKEFIAESVETKTGKWAGLRYISFQGKRNEERLQRYFVDDFIRISPPVQRAIEPVRQHD